MSESKSKPAVEALAKPSENIFAAISKEDLEQVPLAYAVAFLLLKV